MIKKTPDGSMEFYQPRYRLIGWCILMGLLFAGSLPLLQAAPEQGHRLMIALVMTLPGLAFGIGFGYRLAANKPAVALTPSGVVVHQSSWRPMAR